MSGKAEPVASAPLVLRLAFSCSTRRKRAYVLSALRTPLAHANATARACAEERAGIAGLITLRQSLPTYRGCASGTPRRALDSTQGKPCSVALLGLAFTMAEILLSLTIIGVVAAITLPSLTGNINERTWNTQRKALYARFSQAIALMPSLNAYGTLTEGVDSSGSTVVTEDTAAETFVTNGLAKVLKINNICDNEHLQDCGLPEKFTAMHGSQYDFPTDNKSVNLMLVNAVWEGHTSDNYSHANVKAAAFETINGESIAVFYNPSCTSGMNEESYNVQSKVCMMSIYDLNGTKGPNTVGKDMGFIGALYPSDSVVVAPMPYVQLGEAMPFEDAKSYCKNLSSGEYRLPNLDEAALIFVFKKYLSDYNSGNFWTGISYDADYAWGQGLGGDRGHQSLKTTSKRVWCVQR